MAGLCEGGNEPPGSLKAIKRYKIKMADKSAKEKQRRYCKKIKKGRRGAGKNCKKSAQKDQSSGEPVRQATYCIGHSVSDRTVLSRTVQCEGVTALSISHFPRSTQHSAPCVQNLMRFGALDPSALVAFLKMFDDEGPPLLLILLQTVPWPKKKSRTVILIRKQRPFGGQRAV
ncbi:hypothetical protein ANN_01521 [Periplaneta americana]|uniref:Uncharacterized protein n=1 Tax=Periplaneta americana TaxID=6978 RepID=A0ABQ8TTT7_PERAM|nr:hypothetical protein ANN_01521 [Periplaneta americana]